MRGAVESRRLVQLDGVNAGGVVAVAWAVSGLMAGLAGVLFASSPLNTSLGTQNYITLMVAAIAAAAWGVLRSMPIAAVVGVLMGVIEPDRPGLPADRQLWYVAVLPALPVHRAGGGAARSCRAAHPRRGQGPPGLGRSTDPAHRRGRRGRPSSTGSSRCAWYVLLAGFVVSMLTWMPRTWESVFNAGLAFSTIFLSITLITGMGGQLSLCQATLAGVGAFTAGQLANHLGLNLLVGGLVGAVLAAVVAVVLALLSLRLKGLGPGPHDPGRGPVLRQGGLRPDRRSSNGQSGLSLQAAAGSGPSTSSTPTATRFSSWHGRPGGLRGSAILHGPQGHRRPLPGGHAGQRDRRRPGSGINLTWQRVLIFALSGAVAGIGGTLLAMYQASVSPTTFNYEFSLVFVVVVVTTGVSARSRGPSRRGIGFVVIQQLLTYVPARLRGLQPVSSSSPSAPSPTPSTPRGSSSTRSARWTVRFERLFFQPAPAGQCRRRAARGHRARCRGGGASVPDRAGALADPPGPQRHRGAPTARRWATAGPCSGDPTRCSRSAGVSKHSAASRR